MNMNNEENYKQTLLHVIKWLGGNGILDSYKPVNAHFANQIVEVCKLVIEGKSLEEACKTINS